MPEPAPPKLPPERPTLSADQIAGERKRGRLAGMAAFLAVAFVIGSVIWTGSIDTDDPGAKPTIAGQPLSVMTDRALAQAERELKRAEDAPPPAQGKDNSKAKSQDKNKKKATPALTVDQAKTRLDDVKEEKDRVEDLANINGNQGVFIGVAVVLSIGLLLLMVPFLFLYQATRARRPETTPVLGVAAALGPLALAAGTVIRALALKDRSAEFVTQSFPTLKAASDEAENLVKGGMFDVIQILVFAGIIALVFWLVKGNYDSMNVGLLPRVVGFIGMALPLMFFVAPPVAFFWVLAIGGVLVGVWPGGLPPAWSQGKAIPWPRRESGGGLFKPSDPGGERNGEVKAVGPGVKDDEDDEPGTEPPGPRKKRKRRN